MLGGQDGWQRCWVFGENCRGISAAWSLPQREGESRCRWTQHGFVLQKSLGVFPEWFPYSSVKLIPHLLINPLTEQYNQL